MACRSHLISSANAAFEGLPEAQLRARPSDVWFAKSWPHLSDEGHNYLGNCSKHPCNSQDHEPELRFLIPLLLSVEETMEHDAVNTLSHDPRLLSHVLVMNSSVGQHANR